MAAAGEQLAFQRDISIEPLLVGSLIADPTQIDVVSATLRSTDFFDQDAGNIFDALCLRREMKEPVSDVNLLIAALKRYGLIGRGKVTVTDLIKWVQSAVPGNARYYAEIIIKQSQARAQLDAASWAIAELILPASDPRKIGATLMEKLETIFTRSDVSFTSISDAAKHAVKTIRDARKDEKLAPQSTGLSTLDNILGGFFPGELTIIAARPSVGKTALAMQICDSISMKGVPVLFISLEMRADELAVRIMCAKANVNNQHVRTGTLQELEIQAMDEVAVGIEGQPLSIYDPPDATLRKIKAAVRMASWQYKLGLVCIDYLQLILPNERRKSRADEVSDLSRGLKTLAREFKVPFVVLCQLNREAESEKPKLSHLRESGSIEQDADNVIAIHRGDKEQETELILLKNRNGPKGTVKVVWRGEATRFEDQPLMDFV
ncbi:MAG: DnaB-like helicase C-terminal domain-containing protein [Pirellulales bacterium]